MNTLELISVLHTRYITGDIPKEVFSITNDSRKVSSQSLFICIKGYTVDGHDYIENAIKKGASVIVLEELPHHINENVCYVKVPDTNRALAYLANKFYNYPSKKLRVIGVTGTNGKTSITNAVNDILRLHEVKTGLTGTIAIDINGDLLPSKNTTGDALVVQETLAKMVSAGVTEVMMEVSSHGLSLGRLWGVEFTTAVFTNLTQDHLDYHGTMENYKQAKALLFSQLGQSVSEGKTAILNADDKATEYYKQITAANILTYGIDNDADYRAENIEYFHDKTEFDIVYPEKDSQGNKVAKERISVPFVGKFNVLNMLAVIATLIERGLSIGQIIVALPYIRPAKGRMEKLSLDEKRNIFIDYAHTPDGVEKVLDSVRMFTKPNRKVYFVVGAGGNRDTKKRPIMGRLASERADYVIFTTDNPRFEPWEDIMVQLAGGATKGNYECIGDREQAIYRAVELAQEGDTIVIAGKGHEKYQIIGDKEVPFDDKEVALEAIKKFPL